MLRFSPVGPPRESRRLYNCKNIKLLYLHSGLFRFLRLSLSKHNSFPVQRGREISHNRLFPIKGSLL